MGAGFARIAAQAVTGRDQPARSPGETPVQELLRHSAMIAGTIIAATVQAAHQAGLGASAPPAQPGTPPRPETPPETPLAEIERGGTLRIALSVDNHNTEPMIGLEPSLLAVLDQSGTTTQAMRVRFEPERLTVAPRDFEKLTIEIVAADTAERGTYTVRFAVADDPLELRLVLR